MTSHQNDIAVESRPAPALVENWFARVGSMSPRSASSSGVRRTRPFSILQHPDCQTPSPNHQYHLGLLSVLSSGPECRLPVWRRPGFPRLRALPREFPHPANFSLFLFSPASIPEDSLPSSLHTSASLLSSLDCLGYRGSCSVFSPSVLYYILFP